MLTSRQTFFCPTALPVTNIKTCTKTAILFALLAVTQAVTAADTSPALDRFSAYICVFEADTTVQFGLNTSAGRVETPRYDGDRVSIPRVRADLLLGRSQGLSFDYYRYDKPYSSSRTANTMLNGQPLSGTAVLDANAKLEAGQLAYKWWLGNGNDVFGFGLGAAYYRATVEETITGATAN